MESFTNDVYFRLLHRVCRGRRALEWNEQQSRLRNDSRRGQYRVSGHRNFLPQQIVTGSTWNIVDVDADWDDESGQVELRIEAQVSCLGSNQSASINGFAFHVTILAALPAN